MKILKLSLLGIILFVLASCSNDFLNINDTTTEKLENISFNTYNEHFEATLEINSMTSKQTLELWESMNIGLEISPKSSGGDPNTYSDLRYQIVRRGESFTTTPDSGPEIHPCHNNKNCLRKPMQPGEWDIRAIIVYPDTSELGAQTVYSNIVEVDVLYPDIDNILSHHDIKTAMDSIWDASIDNADSTGHREFGFAAYAVVDHTGTVEYVAKMAPPGTKVSCPSRAKVNVPFDPDYPTYNANGGWFVIAWFHTHPPHTWCEGCRDTEPSDEDEAISNDRKMPGVLLDFPQNEVCTDHSVDVGYKEIKIGSATRRTYTDFGNIP